MRNYLPATPFLFTLAAAVLLTMAGCKKDKKEDPKPQPTPTNVMTYQVDGAAISASVSTQRSSGELAMRGQSAGGVGLYVDLGAISGPTTVTDRAMVYEVGTGSTWSSISGQTGATSTVRVTAYDAATRKMSGTFTGTLGLRTGTGDTTKIITDGVFTNVTFP